MSSLFAPLPARDFDPYKAAHLYWRAGFGCHWTEAEALAKLGLDAAVDSLLTWPDVPADVPPPPAGELQLPLRAEYEAILKGLSEEERQKRGNERRTEESRRITNLKLWWLDRMRDGPHPLQEKLTLFWHSHFASSFEDKIQESYPMWQQNQLFRRMALAPLPQMLEEVSRNPAMLIWLDNWRSHKDRPNENYARELMELFSMGPGPYSEMDVKESARAFTGWTTDRENYEFNFKRSAHDREEKTFFGKTGEWGGEDIIRMVCEHEATPRFMARKFLHHFLCNNPPEELVDAAAKLYRECGLAPKPFLSALFRSRLFYSDYAAQKVVKSPVVLAIGSLKAMDLRNVDQTRLLEALRLMGQDLFFPPDVNGWLEGMTWINSNTLLLRYNFSNFLVHGVDATDFKTFDKEAEGMTAADRRAFVESQRAQNAFQWSPRAQLEERGLDRRLASDRMLVEHFVREYLQRPVDRATFDNYLRYCQTDAAGGRADYSLASVNFDERTMGLIHLVMSSPEYQLC